MTSSIVRRAGWAAGGLTVGLALTACGSSSSGAAGQVAQSSAATSPTATATSSSPAPVSPSPSASVVHQVKGCTAETPLQTQAQIAAHQYAHEPKVTTSPTAYTAKIVTNCGTIVVDLAGKAAPHTVNSFAFLSAKGYFNHTPCHRLTTPSTGIAVLQCGDPTGTGTGGPGYTIPDENLTGAKYPAGTLAMANTGTPHTGGSQFFFVYGPTPLPAKYTPFGHITSGLNILTRIAAAGDNSSNGPGDGSPNQPVEIESFTVTKGAPS